eukprot:2428292-Pyramimonas_sp.AAC.1
MHLRCFVALSPSLGRGACGSCVAFPCPESKGCRRQAGPVPFHNFGSAVSGHRVRDSGHKSDAKQTPPQLPLDPLLTPS